MFLFAWVPKSRITIDSPKRCCTGVLLSNKPPAASKFSHFLVVRSERIDKPLSKLCSYLNEKELLESLRKLRSLHLVI